MEQQRYRFANDHLNDHSNFLGSLEYHGLKFESFKLNRIRKSLRVNYLGRNYQVDGKMRRRRMIHKVKSLKFEFLIY